MKPEKIIALGIVIVIVIGGYFLVTQLASDNTKKEKPKVTATPSPKVEAPKTWTKEELSAYILPIMEFAKGTEEYLPKQLSDSQIFETCIRLLATDEFKKEIDQDKVNSLKREGETSVIPAENIKLLAKRYFNRDNFQIDSSFTYTYDESRDVYATTKTFGWTGGGEQAFSVTDLKQDQKEVTLTIRGYYDPQKVNSKEFDTTYQANLTCDNVTCQIESIIKK